MQFSMLPCTVLVSHQIGCGGISHIILQQASLGVLLHFYLLFCVVVVMKCIIISAC